MLGAARELDRMLAATRRVEDGDYSVRAREDPLGPAADPGARARLRHDGRPAARLDEEQRRTLLADVSHELRTPLTVITGNLEAIVDGVYPADAAHLAPILDETRVLERLIDDLRTVSLSEAGTLPLHPEPTDPDLLIGEVARSFRPAAEAAAVDGRDARSPDDLPIVEVDPVRIREVLANLVANAPPPHAGGRSVTIAGRVADGSAGPDASPTPAPASTPRSLPHVFDRFVKGDRLARLRARARDRARASWRPMAGRSRSTRRPVAGRRSGSTLPLVPGG